jgi:predicted  nucleic acid-binding Zn-ribbon protein
LQDYESLVNSKAKLQQDLQQKDQRIKETEGELNNISQQKNKNAARWEEQAKQNKGSMARLVQEVRSRCRVTTYRQP